ncbi:amino acid adenylation domain-containing protein [Kribbella sp. NPDC050459]|uniref:amino acid adenylation domain-containing protein n=1 Tax=Kribbella sp. NPDC050459 TaxID=3155785 RepID=UPI0033E02CC1
MHIGTLVEELRLAGVVLWEESGAVRYRAPRGVLTGDRLATLRTRRDEVLDYLRQDTAAIRPSPEQRHERFPLSDVQSAYLLGRRDAFDYGGVGCHGYGELEFTDLDAGRLQAAWNAVIARHDMLRAIISADGYQRVLEQVPEFEVPVLDLRTGAAPSEFLEVRAAMDHRVYSPDSWPMFDLRVTRLAGRDVVHLSLDFLVCDFVSIRVVLGELLRRYDDPGAVFPELEISYRDYLVAERESRSGSRHARDRDYWLGRLDSLPAAPVLPVVDESRAAPPRFRRWATTLTKSEWAALREQAARFGLTPSSAVLTAYAEVIAAWSAQPAFTLDITVLNRLPVHPQVDQLVGDFTSVSLLAVDADRRLPLRERARALQAQLWQDLDHGSFTGIEVVRELARTPGRPKALFPVVFTSAIGMVAGDAPADGSGARPSYGISQTPQVWIDCQNIERDGQVDTNWDVRDGVFPDGVVDAMFAAFAGLLREMAATEAIWEAPDPVPLPADQRARREECNGTDAAVPEDLLHAPVMVQAERTPDRVAVECAQLGRLTYGDLAGRARGVAGWLVAAGCTEGDLVLVTADKGAPQVIAVLGALLAGAAYVPVDTSQPPARRDQIIADARPAAVLTTSAHLDVSWPSGTAVLAVDTIEPADAPDLPRLATGPDDLAYVIYTSGSTGTPKGVMISHRGARNTVADINDRFDVGEDDAVLGLASLGFDLSVYDIFGPLSVGGRLVLPEHDRRGDPSHWAALIANRGVTVWNSVPAQMQMLSDYLASAPGAELPTLRVALLSGDWIPVNLPDAIRERVPGVELISLGGATEASIWSIWHPIKEVPSGARSIPYGVPLTNQRFHVLDAAFRDCPDWVRGELFIGGVGLALGYHGDQTRTAERFVEHPVSGERLYRTGDLGRYLPDGTIEFLGRADSQVKIRGHRIELGEVDSALQSCPGVAASAVIVDGADPLQRHLVGFVQPATLAAQAQPAPASLVPAARDAGNDLLVGLEPETYLTYLRELDEVALLAMVRTLRSADLFTDGAAHDLDTILTRAEVAPAHRRLVRRWLRALVTTGHLEHLADGRYRLLRDADDELVSTAWKRIEELREAAGDDTELVDYFHTSATHLAELVRADADPLQLLFPKGSLEVSEDLYADALFNRWANRVAAAAVRELVSAMPADAVPRVLEVGAGGGGTTAAVLAGFADGEVDYLVTDLSPYFLSSARERFGHLSSVRYARYDLDEDFRAQGLRPNSFDIIVAGDVLHATADVGRTLGRLHELLAPGGWICFLEMTRDHYQIMTSLELLTRLDDTGDFADERRGTDDVFLSRGAWQRQLERQFADVVHCLPEPDDDLLGELGMTVFLARFKSDRARLDADAVRDHVAGRLPSYMVPAGIEVVDQLPLTGNGKVDLATLGTWVRLPEGQAPEAAGQEPANELEQAVATTWAEILELPVVGRDQSFFALGGDSLLAAKLAGRLIEAVPAAGAVFFDQMLRCILDAPTVAQQAEFLAGHEEPGAAVADDAPPMKHRLVPLRNETAADGHIVVLVPPVPGVPVWGPLLAQLPDGLQPVAAFDTSYDGHSEAELEAMIGEYAQLLAERQGPATIVGVGAGGRLALELSLRCAEQGQDVRRLVVVAGTTPPDQVSDPVLIEDLCLRELGLDPALAVLPGEHEAADGSLPDAQVLAHCVDGYGRLVNAFAERPWPVYAGDVTLIVPDGEPASDPATEWERACLGDFAVRRLDQASPWSPEVVAALANEVSRS